MANLINQTDTLNQGREKLNAAIQDAEYAKTDSGKAVATSRQAEKKADSAVAHADSVQEQFNQVVIEGDSSVEAAQARVDEGGTAHATLKERLDSGFSEVNQQLADAGSSVSVLKKSEAYVDDYEGTDTEKINAALLELSNGGTLHFSGRTYNLTGVEIHRPVNLKGAGSSVTLLRNSGTGKMISYTYENVGLTDLRKRSPITIEDLRFEDSATGTGTGIYMYHTYFTEINRCHFENFHSGYGAYIEEGLWNYFNHITTNKSEIYCISNKTPHFNNQIFFNGGEIRNPSRYGLYVENADGVAVRDLSIEGNSTGTAIYGAYFKNTRMVSMEEVYTEHIQSSQACVRITNSQSLNISLSTIAANIETVPSLWLTDVHMIEIDKCTLNFFPIKTDGTCNAVTIKDTGLWGKIDIADGHYYKFENCSPLASTVIPVDPRFQEEIFNGKGIPFSNRYTDSSFRTGVPTVTASTGAPVAEQDTTTGYYDNNSLKITGVANDKALIQGLGRIESAGQGAVISFMAKAQTEADFMFSPSIAVASGGNKVNVKTSWRRYFVVSLLQPNQTALASVHMWATFFGQNTLWIDDVQVMPINSYNEASKIIECFRYVPTHGSLVLNDTKPITPYLPFFDKGIQFRKYSYAPPNPQEGQVYFADGVSWNPNNGGKGLYFYDGTAYVKL